MSRLVPYPLLTAALILMWLLLNRFSLGPPACSAPPSRSSPASRCRRCEPAKPRLRRWDLIPRLLGDRAPRHRPLEPRGGRG